MKDNYSFIFLYHNQRWEFSLRHPSAPPPPFASGFAISEFLCKSLTSPTSDHINTQGPRRPEPVRALRDTKGVQGRRGGGGGKGQEGGRDGGGAVLLRGARSTVLQPGPPCKSQRGRIFFTCHVGPLILASYLSTSQKIIKF